MRGEGGKEGGREGGRERDLGGGKNDIQQMDDEFPWKPPLLYVPPFLEWVHEVELQLLMS